MVKYYSAGGTPVAVRHCNGTGTNGLVYLFGDHLGSTSITGQTRAGYSSAG